MTILQSNPLLAFSQLCALLDSADYWIWDFDGVIKESVQIKEEAFKFLFPTYSNFLLDKISRHHRSNLGISRSLKIPLYYSFGHSSKISADLLTDLLHQFSDLVVDRVISSEFVPGFLYNMLPKLSPTNSLLVSATPQDEIERILDILSLKSSFRTIYGGPRSKFLILSEVKKALKHSKLVYIGDSLTDFLACEQNDIPFIFRKHALNSFDGLPSSIPFIYSFL